MTWDYRGDAFRDEPRPPAAEAASEWLRQHNAHLVDLESRVRDLNAICAVLTYINGRDVGLGSWQTRIPADVALTIREQLPADPDVVMSMDDGALVITVV